MISVLATILFTFNTAHAGDTEEFSALLDRFGIKGAFFREARINQQIVRKADERQYREFQLKNEKLEGTLVVEEISPVDASFAKKFKTLNYGTILESYQNHRNPYTGHATVTIVCPQEAMPEHAALEFAGSQADAIVANTSRTNAFGVCLRFG